MRWRADAALIRKTFVYDAGENQAGAFYLWPYRAAAERAHDAAWRRRIVETYGSEPVIRYFETPLVVDNVLGATMGEGVTRGDTPAASGPGHAAGGPG